jgi:predicted CXXCH cytochrome family protein
MRRFVPICFAMVVAVLIAVPAGDINAQEANLNIEAMSPHRLETRGWASNVSSGLRVVPKGTVVYLSANDLQEDSVISVSWQMVSVPSGSATTLDSTTSVWTTFRPDTTGQYNVRVTITTASGTDDTTITFTSAKFTGVGSVGGVPADIAKGQCAACHNGVVQPDKFTSWDQTGHATKVRRAIDGIDHSFYAESCIHCHTMGYDDQPAAANNGFDDQQRATGWTFPSVRQPGNWDALVANYPQLAQVAVIGCENCHGPGNQHFGTVSKTDKSLEVGVCAQCHDEPWRHNFVSMWENSKHAEMPSSPAGRSGCDPCHSGSGFASRFKDPTLVPFEKDLTCAGCHDPHSAQNEHLLRTVTADPLMDGTAITVGGLGQLCMNCHRSRRDAETYAVEYHSRFGPHYGPQADMLLGTNAVEFGHTIPSSTHQFAVADGCVGCHMYATPDTGQAGRDKIGGHSFAMHSDDGTEVENVAACASCHGPISSFNGILAAADYDGDGTIEGVQSEVKGMLTNLALLLPPVGVDDVVVDTTYTVSQLQSAYNYLFVLEDKSSGVHNTKYAVNLLRYSIGVITGVEPVDETIPFAYALEQNYPNPFNPATTIDYSIPEKEFVRLEVYDILGRRVRTLVNEDHAPGNYVARWDGTDQNGLAVSSGIYLYKIQAGSFAMTKKMMLLK